MAKNVVSPEAAASPPDWSTTAARVRWLIDTKFNANRRAFATSVGFSHTSINKVASGERAPGLKLVTAIVQSLNVNPTWLVDGRGQPYRGASDLGTRGLAVTDVLLPGPVVDNLDLLTLDWFEPPDEFFTPTQYWLLLTPSQPLVRNRALGFKPGDHLLMETDRARFPAPERLLGRLCAVRVAAGGPVRLVSVTHHDADPDSGPERLEVDLLDPRDQDANQVVRQEVYMHHPGGEVSHFQRLLKVEPSQGRRRLVPRQRPHIEPAMPTVEYANIVGVWTQILRRPGGVGT